MIPQGQNIINVDHYKNLIDRVNGCTECAELQKIVSEAFASIKAQEAAALAQLKTLQPMLALLEAPTSPTAVISWVKNFINGFLTPYLKPVTTYAAQVAELTAQVAALSSAISSVAAKLPNCAIKMPTP